MEEIGKRFSLVYLDRGTPSQDSQRFRNRLAAYYWENIYKEHNTHILNILKREAGIEVPYISNWGWSVTDVFKKGELRDVLDAITLVYQSLISSRYHQTAELWKSFVARVFTEENVGYTVDQQCGVHFFVDQEFESSRVSTLSVLDDPRYTGVRAAFDDAYRHLDSDSRDTKASVRSMFESIEILVKQMVKTKNLNKWCVENTLRDKCLTLYSSNPVAKTVVSGLFEAMARWVDTLHNYRHGQVAEEPIAPDEQVTIHIISTGSSYLRWLAQMDTLLNKE
jgi:hypothetical protein